MTEGSRSEDWQRADQELRRSARSRAGALALGRVGVHARLGYGSFREYVERLFGC